MLRGSCLCKGIQYEISGPLKFVRNCHCSMCRKVTGAAFRTRAAVRNSDFRWTKGEELVGRYESSPGEFKAFCKVCGSTLGTFFPNAPHQTMGLALGTLDDNPGVRPGCHVYVASKAPWYEITDDLPQFEEEPGEGY